MELAKYTFQYDGNVITEPRNWADISVNLAFDESPQATIDVDEMEFVNDSAQTMQTDLLGGLDGTTNGYFEGKEFRILAGNGTDSLSIFDGFVNWKESQINSPISITAKIQKADSINSLQERAESNTFGYLEDIGLIGLSDYTQLPYINEKIDISADLIIISLSLYIMTKESIDAFNRFQTTAANAVGHLTGGITGAGASAFVLVATVALEAIYLAVVIIAINKLIKDIIELLYPKKKFLACTSYRTLLEKASEHLGYAFKSDISQLDNVYYVPSMPYLDSNVSSGIPKVNDYGYNISDFFKICSDTFYAKFGIIDNELHLRTDSDAFWAKNSTFKMHEPYPFDEVINYNVDDLKTSRLTSFATDLSDEYTIINFTGTNYQVLTKLKNPKNKKFDLVKGSEQINIPLSLGNRKNELTALEKALKTLFAISDTFTGGNSANSVKSRIGSMIISNPTFNVPKSVYLENGLIPLNHRDKWSAKVLEQEYHNEKSFIQNDYRAQKQVFNQIKIPFGFSDALKVYKNSFFELKNGTFGKFTNLKWHFNSDYAIVDYWVRKKYDTESLKEIFIEG